jgi:hypothetical protein
MKGLSVIAEMYTDDALDWARLNCDLSRPRSPDDAFRNKMIAAAKSSQRD